MDDRAARTVADDWDDIQAELLSASREACGGGFTWPSEEIRAAFGHVEMVQRAPQGGARFAPSATGRRTRATER